MSALDVIMGIAVSLLLVFPGVLLVFAIFPRRSLVELFFLGSVVGWSAIIVVMRHFPLSWWPVGLGLLYIVTGATAYSSALKSTREKIVRIPGGGLLLLLGVLGFAAQIFPVMAAVLPPGEQSMYHLVLANKILLTGKTPSDWQPFAAIPVNYAIGAHLWTALTAKLGGMTVDFSFRISFAVAAFFIAGLIYLLTMEIFEQDKRSSFFASLLWGAASIWGGRQMFLTGQLPHMIGMMFLLTFLLFMLAESNLRGQILMGVLGAGMLCCHQHTALVITGLIVMSALVGRALYGRVGPLVRNIAIAVCFTAVIVPGEIIRDIVLLLHPAGADIYHFREFFMPIQVLAQSPGLFILFAGGLGLALLLMRPISERSLIPAVWATALLAMLALFGYLYRVLSFGYFGGFCAMFTPSALITDLSLPLCIAGGWYIGARTGFYRFRAFSALIAIGLVASFHFINGLTIASEKGFPVIEFLKAVRPPVILLIFLVILWLAEKEGRRLAEKISVVLIVLALLLFSRTGTLVQLNMIRKQIGLQESVDLRELKLHMPMDAIILNMPTDFDFGIYGWLPYWTWSECSYLVLPSTEQRHSEELNYKRKVLQMDIFEAQMQSNVQARPVILFTPPEADYTQYGYKVVYESLHRRIQLYEP